MRTTRYTRHIIHKAPQAVAPEAPALAVATVPQSQKLEEEQVANRAGGFSYQIEDLGQIKRFLVLGAGQNGTFYATELQLTRENAAIIQSKIDAFQGSDVVKLMVDMRTRVPKMKPTYLAAAMVQSGKDLAAKWALRDSITDILWAGTDFLPFVAYTDDLWRWGKAFQHTCQQWYGSKTGLQLAKSLTKYRNREDWRHRDVFLKASVKPLNADQNLVFKYIVARDLGKEDRIEEALEAIFDASSPAALYLQAIEMMWSAAAEGEYATALDIVRDNGLPREVLPTELLSRPETWDALLDHMGGIALLRNLGNMS